MTGTTCAGDLNGIEGPTYATDGNCLCTGKKYFPNGITAFTPIAKPPTPICVTNCSEYYLSFIANDSGYGNDKCASCLSINPALDYFDIQTGTCVASTSCTRGVPDPAKKVCVTCLTFNPSQSFYDLDKNICVTQCSLNSVSIIDSTNKTCKDCISQKKVMINNVCSICPTTPIVSYYFEYLDNTSFLTAKCVELVKDNMFLHNNIAVVACPTGFITDLNHICQPCGYYLGNCVLNCPDKFVKQSDNICKTCKSLNLFYYNNTCVQKCPYVIDSNTTGSNSENICLPCSQLNKLSSLNECVDTCPSNLITDTAASKCIYCYKDIKYRYKETCVDQCPAGYTLDKTSYTCIEGNI